MFLTFLRSHGRLKPDGAAPGDSKAVTATDYGSEVHLLLHFFPTFSTPVKHIKRNQFTRRSPTFLLVTRQSSSVQRKAS